MRSDRGVASVGGIVYTADHQTTNTYSYNGVGSTILLTAGTGTARSIQYDAFGEVLHSDEGVDEERLANTKERDKSTGLYFHGARYYDSSLGRYISLDPARDGLNFYVYARNAPLSFVDPTGLQSQALNEPNDMDIPWVISEKEIRDKYPDAVEYAERELEKFVPKIFAEEEKILEALLPDQDIRSVSSISNNYDPTTIVQGIHRHNRSGPGTVYLWLYSVSGSQIVNLDLSNILPHELMHLYFDQKGLNRRFESIIEQASSGPVSDRDRRLLLRTFNEFMAYTFGNMYSSSPFSITVNSMLRRAYDSVNHLDPVSKSDYMALVTSYRDQFEQLFQETTKFYEALPKHDPRELQPPSLPFKEIRYLDRYVKQQKSLRDLTENPFIKYLDIPTPIN